jgi:ribosomal protein S18 acetylase RimI-like enzyme
VNSKVRIATKEDIDAVVKIYDAIIEKEESGELRIGWKRGVYPTENTALEAFNRHSLYVCEDNGKVVASARIDQNQVPEYADANWIYDVDDKQVMVLHTLVIDPNCLRSGYGRRFIDFYEQHALEHNCHYLRIDTNEINTLARKMYKKLGYEEIGIVSCEFNGITNVQLVCLEKKI